MVMTWWVAAETNCILAVPIEAYSDELGEFEQSGEEQGVLLQQSNEPGIRYYFKGNTLILLSDDFDGLKNATWRYN